MLRQDDVDAARRDRRVRCYFRYRLHTRDFHDLYGGGTLRGHYTAKPLYGRVDAQGRVDRSGGYDGRIAVLFLPEPVDPDAVRLLFARLPPPRLTTGAGRRNWPLIREAAESALRRELRLGS